MTDSQNNKIQAKSLDDNKIQANLTEQWKKGKLPEGWYYCNTENGVELLKTWVGLNKDINLENMHDEVFISDMDDCQILAPVPTYEELQDMEKVVHQAMAANIKLVDKNKMLGKLLDDIDGTYSAGVNKREDDSDEFIIYKSTFDALDKLFHKWEKIRKEVQDE